VTSELKIRSPNVVASEEGQLQIARVGLSVIFRGQHYFVDSEMLEQLMSIAVSFRASRAAEADDAAQIRGFIADTLAFRGFNVEFV
jgi:hypothetical protein